MISDSCINLFGHIDLESAREHAKKWWATQGNYQPDNSGPALEALEPTTYQVLKDYAVLEAGRNKAKLSKTKVASF